MNIKGAFGLSVFISFFCLSLAPAYGQTSPGDEALFSGSVKPNVLLILDNSNSMDEDFFGNAVGSWSTGSKAVEGKRVLNNLVTTYANSMRLGLMANRLPRATKGFIYNTLPFVSYDPRSYCPTPVDACVEYCRTGSITARSACQSACNAENPDFAAAYIDDSITGLVYGSDSRNKYCGLAYPKTNRIPNPADSSRYIYFKQPLPFYDTVPAPDLFGFSLNYIPNDQDDDRYQLYEAKTGTSDGPPPSPPTDGAGYSLWREEFLFSSSYFDSDVALGYKEFGKRLALFYVGQAWYNAGQQSPPGDGYLHVPVDENKSDNRQLEALLAKLQTHEGKPGDYMSCSETTNPNRCSYLVSAGLTPTPGTFQDVIAYFQGNYPKEESGGKYPTPIQSQAANCQRNFIVYVTDGLPSVDESGAKGTADSLMPSVIGKVQTLRSLEVLVGGNIHTYDIRTYVVGVGLTEEAKAKVDAMAQAGGTAVEGRAYYADNPEQLQEALSAIFTDIQSGTYSFSQPSVSAVRSSDENFIYVASFEPKGGEPFWKGILKKIAIQEDGSLGSTIWEAGSVLEGTTETGRNIKTLLWGYLENFTTDLSPLYFGLPWFKTEERDQIVGFVRGKSTLPYSGVEVPNPDYPRKLGDIFHANPVTIGSPSIFFNDPRDRNQAFKAFRENNPRTSANGKRIVITGANDGQIHAFETGMGSEVWSFIPPNLLPKLKDWAHTSHPTTKKHKYFVDGPISAADVWLGTGDGTGKLATEWKTLAVVGLGMGVRGFGDKPNYLWSALPDCIGPFRDKYHGIISRFYCGYYALDVTNTASFPSFKWVLDPSGTEAPYLGEPWSKMVMGKVKINGQEKWVGFIGGGYTMGTPPAAKEGKGFFVVDLRTGDVLWSYTARDDNAMGFIPGTPAIVDRDNDGFIDTAYVGDLSGNLWKFTFCPLDPDEAACGTGDWQAMILYAPGENKLPTFNTPAVAKDQNYYWVFWGTGDKANPNNEGPQNKFLAIRDQNQTSAYTLSNLQNITSIPTFTETAKNGWYINFTGQERALSDATVFSGIVFFTSYNPPTDEDLCGAAGAGALYGIAMMPISIGAETYDPGKGVFPSGEALGRRIPSLGTGIPSAPVISLKPVEVKGGAPDVYVTVSGGAGTPAEIKSSSGISEDLSKAMAGSGPTTNIIHWRDLRVQP